jgi:serine/threonine protein kinase
VLISNGNNQKYLTSVKGQNLTRVPFSAIVLLTCEKEIMKQILEGVHELHELNIVHRYQLNCRQTNLLLAVFRDLKPENIALKNICDEDLYMLEEALSCIETRLIDFGSAVDEVGILKIAHTDTLIEGSHL